MTAATQGRCRTFTPEELLSRRHARQAAEFGPYVRNHPLGHIRDLPETTKELTRKRPFIR